MASNVMTKSNGKATPNGKATAKASYASPKLDMRDAVSCEISFEKCKGGFRIQCCCDDSAECSDLQCLCAAIGEGNCSCCCTRNEKPICTFNLGCDRCKCENTDDGCCITCTSGDAECCEMLEACCDCLECCCQNGCCCYIYFGDKCCCFGGCSA